MNASLAVPDPITKLPKRKLRLIIADPRESARAVKLRYVSDTQEGILRKTAGSGFYYLHRGRRVKDKQTLARIRSLVIPPAWENVWICANENGHLQATGVDAKGRKQYRYHHLWTSIRNHTKFYRLADFGTALPAMRKRIRQDLAIPGLAKNKVLATVVALMERTSIRIGNEEYEKANGSIGLTTMKTKHVKVTGTSLRFSFTGKKGKDHLISIKSKRLSAIVRHCREIPGRELFQYYNDEGERQSIDSGMVNDYIREISGSDFTAKDFRTWAGSVHCLIALKGCASCSSSAEAKKNFIEVLDQVAAHLGNTRSVCKKYYVHPCLESLYLSNRLQRHLDKLELKAAQPKVGTLAPEERLLMKLLQYHNGK